MRLVALRVSVLSRVTVILFVFAQTLLAQGGLRPIGLTAAVGLGAGSAALACSSCTRRVNSQSGFARVGYAFDSTFGLSAQVRAWQKSGTDENDTFTFFLLGGQYRPIRGKDFYLEGGLGSGSIALTFRELLPDGVTIGETKTTTRGSAIAVGAGYDIRLSRGFAVTPFVHAMATSAAHAHVNGVEQNSNLSGNLVQLGVALTWQQLKRRRYIPTGER